MDTASPLGKAADERSAVRMTEIWQAARMLTVQLEVTITEALTRLHDYARDADRLVGDVAYDIVHRRLHLSSADVV